MLVEDDNHLRDIYEARLIAEGYTVVSSGDGEAALASVVKEKPDLIISDVMMPKISGFDMLDILRSTPEVAHTKVIMMTALSQAEDRTRASSLGADKYLVKSQVTLEDVVRTVHEVLGDNTPEVQTPMPVTPAPTTAQPVVATPIPVSTPTALPVNPVTQPQIAPMPQAPTPVTPVQPTMPVAAQPGTTPATMPTTTPTSVNPVAAQPSTSTPQAAPSPVGSAASLVSPIRPVEVPNGVPVTQAATHTPSASQAPQHTEAPGQTTNLQQKIDTASVASTFMSPGTIVNPTANTPQSGNDDSLESAFDAQTAYNDVLKSIGASTSPDSSQPNQTTPPSV